MVLAPAQTWLGRPFWTLEAKELPQLFVIALAYLGVALAFHVLTEKLRAPWIGEALAWGMACFAAAASIIAARADIPLSRGLFLGGMVLGIALALIPYLVRRWRLGLTTTVACAVLALGLVGVRQTKREDTGHRRIRGALYASDISYFSGLVSRPVSVRGGGITAYGTGFVLATGEGDIYRLWWNEKGDSLRSQDLRLKAPIGPQMVTADMPNPGPLPRLRAADLVLDTLSSPTRIIVSHMYWNRSLKCMTVRVSATNLDSAALQGRSSGVWQTLYETHPCLKPIGGFDDVEVGGRLAWMPDRTLLLSTGDFGSNGLTLPAVSQQMDNDYGKILQLDGKGGSQIFSSGHRNPQGLLVARDGRIWETEHGPQGGDEINLIVKGANYGWPLATYGAQYGLNYWPLSPTAHDHGSFTEPAHVFVPSVAVSDMIEMSGRQFPLTRGDLMIASLRTQKLLRARLRGDRVIYVKETQLDRRIRALAEGSDGRIAMWTDEGDILVMARAPWEFSGQVAYATCAACHETNRQGSRASAPTLHGVLGRRVGSVPDFDYTPALNSVGGKWTRERLDEFLKNPGVFAPGTLMQPWGVAEKAQRAALLDYLQELK